MQIGFWGLGGGEGEGGRLERHCVTWFGHFSHRDD